MQIYIYFSTLQTDLRVATLSTLLCCGRPGTTALGAAWLATCNCRSKGKVNVLLALSADNERRHVHNLLADAMEGVRKKQNKNKNNKPSNLLPNVPTTNQNTSMVDRTSKSLLQNLGLETTLKHVLDLETKDVIELVL